jgi:hypothetical protein
MRKVKRNVRNELSVRSSLMGNVQLDAETKNAM